MTNDVILAFPTRGAYSIQNQGLSKMYLNWDDSDDKTLYAPSTQPFKVRNLSLPNKPTPISNILDDSVYSDSAEQ